MLSAAEAEIGAMYINAREAVPIRKTLMEMGHAQPPTPLQTDNSAAHSVVSRKVQPRRTKAMDIRLIGCVVETRKDNSDIIGVRVR